MTHSGASEKKIKQNTWGALTASFYFKKGPTKYRSMSRNWALGHKSETPS